MYAIEKTNTEVIIKGPDGYQKNLPKCAVGIVLRENVEEPWDGVPRPYTVQIGSMTDTEIVACALGMQAYPGVCQNNEGE
jgi:hypothetical protein